MIQSANIETNIAVEAMSMENSLLQSYRTLFLGIEAGLLTVAFALLQFRVIHAMSTITILGVVGLVFCGCWIVVCRAKGADVDGWMRHLTEISAEKGHFKYMKEGLGFQGGRFARHWFNEVMPSCVIGLWIWVLIARDAITL